MRKRLCVACCRRCKCRFSASAPLSAAFVKEDQRGTCSSFKDQITGWEHGESLLQKTTQVWLGILWTDQLCIIIATKWKYDEVMLLLLSSLPTLISRINRLNSRQELWLQNGAGFLTILAGQLATFFWSLWATESRNRITKKACCLVFALHSLNSIWIST